MPSEVDSDVSALDGSDVDADVDADIGCDMQGADIGALERFNLSFVLVWSI